MEKIRRAKRKCVFLCGFLKLRVFLCCYFGVNGFQSYLFGHFISSQNQWKIANFCCALNLEIHLFTRACNRTPNSHRCVCAWLKIEFSFLLCCSHLHRRDSCDAVSFNGVLPFISDRINIAKHAIYIDT